MFGFRIARLKSLAPPHVTTARSWDTLWHPRRLDVRLHSTAAALATQSSIIQLARVQQGKSEAERPRAARRRNRRGLKYLPFSPNAVKPFSPTTRLTYEARNLYTQIAQSRSLRLPIVTHQIILRQSEAQHRTSFSDNFDDEDWRERLTSLAFKGINKSDIEHWAWIMTGQTGDEKIERLVSTGSHKALFLLLHLLHWDAWFCKPSSIKALLDHVSAYYCTWESSESSRNLPFGTVRRTLDPRLNMTVSHFLLMLRRLVRHTLRVWPVAIVSVAHVVSAYIESIPCEAGKSPQARAGYKNRCTVFNAALQLFQWRSSLQPLEQMQHNWRAQRALLAASAKLDRPLIINYTSYRAIRRVMIGLKKSPAERVAASQLAKTWPPYAEKWTGMDERRKPEDDLSRSVKAGTLMREAGYADTEHDLAISVLGGFVLGESPTIQTTTPAPKLWKGQHAAMNMFSIWVARVKATRNAHEAWNAFRTPPIPNLKPDVQVYAAMFDKLLAPEADPSMGDLPGDTKAVLPVHDANLTEFERARIKPPGADELYERLLKDGIRPVGKCLALLVRNAASVDAAVGYIRDSPLPAFCASSLATPQAAEPDALRRIPPAIFDSFIRLLCDLQHVPAPGDKRTTYANPRSPMRHALTLVNKRFERAAGRNAKSAYHTILASLARKTPFRDALRHEQNDNEALSIFWLVYTRAKKTTGFDVVMFNHLCGVLRKAMLWKHALRNKVLDGTEDGCMSSIGSNAHLDTSFEIGLDSLALIRHAYKELKTAFAEVVAPSVAEQGGQRQGLNYPALYHSVHAAYLQNYMRTAGYLHDAAEMIRVVEWLMSEPWANDDMLLEEARTPGTNQHAMMMRMLCFFRAYLGVRMPDVARQVEHKIGLLNERGFPWGWPDDEELELYLQCDVGESAQMFWAMTHGMS